MTQENLLVATWNVNSVRARKQRFVAWLERTRPSIVCLQETKVLDADFPIQELADLGYTCALRGEKGRNGVALCADTEIGEVVTGFDDGEPDEQARLIAARIHDLWAISVYVPNGQEVGSDKYDYKLNWMTRLRSFLDRLCTPDEPVVLCGDFNVAPADIDTYDPDVWRGGIMCSDAERAHLAAITEWGLHDGFRRHNQQANQFTWWDYRYMGFQKDRGLRIDHIYLSNVLANRVAKSWVDRDERKGKLPSDHAPLLLRLSDNRTSDS